MLDEGRPDIVGLHKKWLLYFSALLLILLFSGCSEEPERPEEAVPLPEQEIIVLEPEFLHLLPEEADELLKSRPATLIVDLREADELNQVRIPGSQPVVFEELINGRVELPKDKPLLLVCSIGGRSYAAGLVLDDAGYQYLYTLKGGIHGWQQAGLPVETGELQPSPQGQ